MMNITSLSRFSDYFLVVSADKTAQPTKETVLSLLNDLVTADRLVVSTIKRKKYLEAVEIYADEIRLSGGTVEEYLNAFCAIRLLFPENKNLKLKLEVKEAPEDDLFINVDDFSFFQLLSLNDEFYDIIRADLSETIKDATEAVCKVLENYSEEVSCWDRLAISAIRPLVEAVIAKDGVLISAQDMLLALRKPIPIEFNDFKNFAHVDSRRNSEIKEFFASLADFDNIEAGKQYAYVTIHLFGIINRFSEKLGLPLEKNVDGRTNLLSRCGEALYGERWQTDLAKDLEITPRTARRLDSGFEPLSKALRLALITLLYGRIKILKNLLSELESG